MIGGSFLNGPDTLLPCPVYGFSLAAALKKRDLHRKHELTHSTGHAKRLDRLDSTAFFGSEDYSKEELVAEIGSCALVHHCGLETRSSFRNSTAYIQNWLQVLKNDKRFIVSASSKADKAVAFILEGR